MLLWLNQKGLIQLKNNDKENDPQCISQKVIQLFNIVT